MLNRIKPRVAVPVGCVFAALCVVLFLSQRPSGYVAEGWHSIRQGAAADPHDDAPKLGAHPLIELTEPAWDNLKDVQNATLGFQKIFVLSMPSRTDKRDLQSLAAFLTGLEVEFVDGVNGSLIAPQAYPTNWKHSVGTLGCWRAHMNIYQRMVRERIQTALILEDDADWDVMLKAQMTEFARGARSIQEQQRQAQQQQQSDTPQAAAAPIPHSPYGDDWDMLALGHCGVYNKDYRKEGNPYWVSQADDPTVILPEQRTWWRKPNLTPPALSNPRARLVFFAHQLNCFAAYGMSLRGAARFLFDQAAGDQEKGNIDSAMGWLCKTERFARDGCVAAYPTIFGVYKAAGDASKDSDRVGSRARRAVGDDDEAKDPNAPYEGGWDKEDGDEEEDIDDIADMDDDTSTTTTSASAAALGRPPADPWEQEEADDDEDDDEEEEDNTSSSSKQHKKRKSTKQKRWIRAHPETPWVVYPVKLNLEPLLLGATTALPAQFPDLALWKTLDLSSARIPPGRAVWVGREEYGKVEEKGKGEGEGGR